MNKAIFFDRDGVINDNSELYYTFRIQDFKLNPGVTEALKILSRKGYLLIIITNQGGVAKGVYTRADVDKLNEEIKLVFKQSDIEITEIFYCPHHPSQSKCLCRKPGSLLIEKALAKYKIDPFKSYMIGDSGHDIDAAEAVSVKGIRISPNSNLFEELKLKFQNFDSL